MRLRGDGGFTLVETLVAFVMIVVAATMLYRGLTAGLKASDIVSREEDALSVARARLARLGIEIPLQAGRQWGQDNGVVWEMTVRPYAPADEPGPGAVPSAYWATVRVMWREASGLTRARSLELTTIKLGQGE